MALACQSHHVITRPAVEGELNFDQPGLFNLVKILFRAQNNQNEVKPLMGTQARNVAFIPPSLQATSVDIPHPSFFLRALPLVTAWCG